MLGAPLDEAAGAVVMVHGRNATPGNILDLVPNLDNPAFAYVAPAAAGNTWYPYSFMAETASNEPGLSSGLFAISEVIDMVARGGVSQDRIILLGFSQGACLASEFAVRNARRWGGVIAFSGGLIGPPGTVWPTDGPFDGTPVFLGCSDIDAHVPKTRVDESAQVFSAMGAEVTERIYPGMGHLVNDDEIEFAKTLMDQMVV
jgi:predicted esterase